MKKNYRLTIFACFVGYIVQGIINNYTPLLFVTFNQTYGIPLSQIALLISLNFGVQLAVDALCALIIDRTGWRVPIVLAHVLSFIGLVSLAVLPNIMADTFTALIICVTMLGMGGGLLEVLVSPIVEACPTDNKSGIMSLLHSFYCWGHCGVVIISTLFFAIFGIENWHILAIIWASVPFVNAIIFTRAPLAEHSAEEKESNSFKALFSDKSFILFIIIMFCAACCELSVAQWSSAFAEKALGLTKATGDLFGTLFFAALMGLSRVIYTYVSSRREISLEKTIFYSGILCVASYLVISLCPIPIISLIGIGICGFSVGMLWPGTFSLAAANIKGGGTTLFALLALFGDLGCGLGPFVVGSIASAANDNLNIGILSATAFPIIMCLSLLIFFKKRAPARCE
ncbi:MAG: MFS transporter [Ruminococcaceae bacterium]|nr:MFS transporter [Oscillospiraceae bacterium]